jgi:ferredoxin--NADP+ reductase
VTLARFATKQPVEGNKRIVFRFLSSPVELLGDGRVEQVLVVANHLVRDDSGRLQPRATEKESLLDTGLVLRAIGYRGTPFPGLPFDERLGVIANNAGRVVEANGVLPGVYVSGWIKRGAQGVIGSNKKCARDTVRCFFEDIAMGVVTAKNAADMCNLIEQRQPHVVDKAAWHRINYQERKLGREQLRPRVKLTSIDSLLSAANG